MQWLRDQRFTWQTVAIESEASVETNAKKIIAAIEASKKRVFFVTHSKGGLDTLHALLSRKDLWPKVAGWIAYQSPFFGTPMADHWVRKDDFSALAHEVLRRLGGTLECLLNMMVSQRRLYMAFYEDEIKELNEQVPIVTLGTYMPDIPWTWDSVFEPYFRDFMLKKGLETDGIVPWKSAVLPGGSFVYVIGMDHLSIVGTFQLVDIHRAHVWKTMFEVWQARFRL